MEYPKTLEEILKQERERNKWVLKEDPVFKELK